MAPAATATPSPSPEPTAAAANLQERAEQWASLISENDWLTAYTTFAPDLMEVCGSEELADFQRVFFGDLSDPALVVTVTEVEITGEVGHVYLKLKQ